MSEQDQALVQAVIDDTRRLRSRIVDAVRQDAQAARLVTDPATADDLQYLLSLLLRCVNAGVANTSPADDRRLAEIGATWAGRRLLPAELVVVHRVPMRVIIEHVQEVGARIGRRPAQLLGTIHRLLDVCNSLAAAVTDGYHRAEHHRRRAEFLRKLLFGLLGTAELGRQAHHYGLDSGRAYLAFRARPTTGTTTDDLATAYGATFGPPHDSGFCAVVGTDLVGFGTAPPRASVPGVCGVGPPRPLDRLAESFRMATRALDAADRRGLAGVQEFSRLGLLPAISSDGAVSEALCRRYLAPLGATESAAEIAGTLHVYLLEGMHVVRTARRLFVHPNTVRYRISRYEEQTGVNLRGDSTVVFELLWALEHRSAPRRRVS